MPRAVVALVPVAMLFAGALVLLIRKKACAVLQLVGAGCLLLLVLTHVFEALHVLPWMGWGRPDSVGHYLNLATAVAGFTLFPAGYLGFALTRDST